MALRLGKLCGNGPEIWLNLQTKFDIHTVGTDMADELAAIETVATPV